MEEEITEHENMKIYNIGDLAKPIIIIALVSFVSASMVSLYFSYNLFPEVKKSSRIHNGSTFSIPMSKESVSTKQVDKIISRNIFNADDLKESNDKKVEEDKALNAIRSQTSFRLLGTIYGGDPYTGAAIIENSSGEKGTYISNENITKDIVLLEVLKERIIIDNKGVREFIDVKKYKLLRSKRSKKKPKKISSGLSPIATAPAAESFKEEGFERQGTTIKVTDSYRKKLITKDMTKILQDAHAAPYLKDGSLQGFKLQRIREGSIYQKSGLQNEDIVTEINGMPLTDAGQAIALLNSLVSEPNIEVRVERGGVIKNFNFSFE